MNATIANSSEQKSSSPLDAFTGTIIPQPVSPLYKIVLAVVAFAMVLLPAIYILLIALVSWLVFFHATHDIEILGAGSGGATVKLIVYLGPLIAGGILIF